MKIRFLVTRTVKAVGGATFEAGQTYDLAPASAHHWLNRGVAVEVGDDAQPAEDPDREGSLEDLTKAELVLLAQDHGLELDGTLRKQDMIDAIREAAGQESA